MQTTPTSLAQDDAPALQLPNNAFPTPSASQQIGALLQVQWRTMINNFRGRMGGWGPIVSVALMTLWHLLWLAAAVGAAITPSFIGREDIETALPGILFFAMLYWQLAPLITLSLGVSLEMGKLKIYPVSLGLLFLVECLLRLATGFEVILLLGGIFVGLALAGSPFPLGLAASFTLFVAINMFFSAGVRNLVERIFQRRRLREAVLIILVAITVTPQIFVWSAAARGLAAEVFRDTGAVPYWVLPSGPAAQMAVGKAGVFDFLLLLAFLSVGAAFGYRQFVAVCRVGGFSSTPRPEKARGGRHGLRGFFLTHLMPDPTAVMVEKEIVYLWRSPRFRLPFFMGFTFGVIAWVPIMKRWEETFGGWMEQSAVTFITLYAFLLLGPVLFLNRFGFDRESARSYFWLPIGFRGLLVAKNIATVIYGWAELLMVAVVCFVIGLPVGWAQIVEAFGAGTIALLFLMAIGNYMSVRFPVASNPDRVSRAGGGNGLRAAAQFVLFPLSLGPVLATFWVRESAEPAFYALWMGGTAGTGILLYWISLISNSRYGTRQREALLAALSGRHGPLAGE